jgi:hypothetical protein
MSMQTRPDPVGSSCCKQHRRGGFAFWRTTGTAEQWIKEGKQAAHWTRLSCHRFRANEVRLQLSVLAYNLGNLGDGSCCRNVLTAGH